MGLIIDRKGIIGSLFRLKGRINRAKYFTIGLISGTVIYVPIILFIVLYPDVSYKGSIEFLFTDLISILLLICYLLIFVIIGICLNIKRIHDLDLPGTRLWLLFVPIYNIYLGFILQFKKGTTGANKFGKDPITAN